MTAELDPGVIRRLADMHAVYRMFDHAGRLMYIGMSGRAGRRFDQHAEKRWFPLVSTITLEWHATHASAVLAEKRAIAAERPRYNIVGSPLAPRRATAARASSPEMRPEATVLTAVLKVFGDASGLPWQTIAERMGTTKDVVSAQCRALGVPSIPVKFMGSAFRGCRRRDVEEAATRELLEH